MIIGSGLIATAFNGRIADVPAGAWIYAAGVSNSSCTDAGEFERERLRLSDALRAGIEASAFVYFSTCSIMDPDAARSCYVRHKLSMESMVASHPAWIVIRLPQVAGHTPNPHTLLNFLYARISRSESFTLRTLATRNIIDMDDAVSVVLRMLGAPERRYIANVANPYSVPVGDVVKAMESAVGKYAVMKTVSSGASYEIDVSRAMPFFEELKLPFGRDYLGQVTRKYYGSRGSQ